MKFRNLALALLMLGLCFAELIIPEDQPICNLYGIIKTFGTVAGILVGAYAGFVLASSHEMNERNAAKGLLGGVVIGLIIIWIAPLVVTNLVGAENVCGWGS